jgi:hypothetical protein
MGVPFIPDYKAYMTAHAKASNTDPNVKAVLDKYFPDMKASVVAGQYATYKNGRMKFYGSAPKEAGMLSNLDNWIAADPTRGKTWDDMTAPEKEEYNSKEHWRAKKIIEATNSDLRNSTYNQYHTAVTNRTIDIDTPTDSGGGSSAENSIPKPDVAGETTLDKITDETAEKKKFTDSVNKTFADELRRGDDEYKTKFASFFRSPSSKSEALKVGLKDLGFGMRKNLRGIAAEHNIKSSADIDKLIKQPKKLTKFLETT